MKLHLSTSHHEQRTTTYKLPIIDISALRSENTNSPKILEVAEQIGVACREDGFFYVSGHGVSADLEKELERVASSFFALSQETKQDFNIHSGGKTWRGWFPLGQELTSGFPDQKEGIYLGEDLSNSHPEVMKQTPFYGANLCPNEEFRSTVRAWMKEMHCIGNILMRGIALSLGLEANCFDRHGMADPLQLFRIFHYPPTRSIQQWGVGEHTDYGVLTILKQDDQGGLQIKTRKGESYEWIDAPPIQGTFVINIGDMLEKMTYGRYLSTPHRVKKQTNQSRFSFPYFFDPNYHAELSTLGGLSPLSQPSRSRWDNVDIHQIKGTYGEYLLSKVSKVFPHLFGQVYPVSETKERT